MRDTMTTFPALYGEESFNRLAEELFNGSFLNDKQAYPTDIVQISDDKGQVTGYEITVALAGIDKQNVEVSTDNDVLVITVKKAEKTENKTKTFLQRGISQRSMESRYGLHGIDKGNIKATFNEGMLKVELPIAEEVKPRAITIG